MSGTRSQGDAAWQPLVQYAGSHMHERYNDDRLDRSLETAKGGIVRPPEHVVDIFALPVGAQPHRFAISPTGEVAILYWSDNGKDAYRSLCLVRRLRDGARTHPEVLGTEQTIHPTGNIRILYAANTEEPVVIVGKHLFWGGEVAASLPSEWYEQIPAEACLTFWVEDNRRWVAYVESDHAACQFPFHLPSRPIAGTFGLRGHTTWLGVVGGSLARVVCTEEGKHALLWRYGKIVMPNRDLHIIGESISWVTPDSIQFAAWETPTRFRLFYVTPESHTETLVHQSAVFWSQGQIYVKDVDGEQHNLYRHSPPTGTLETVATIRHPEQFPVGNGLRLHHFDDTVVLVDFSNPAKVNAARALIIGTGTDGAMSRLDTRDFCAVRRMHHSLAWQIRGKNGGFRWQEPGAWEAEAPYVNLPLHGLPFDTLAAVEDEVGKAIMNVGFTHHWVHIIRYPLPG